MNEVLAHDDLYDILGISKSIALDKTALRHAYLSRSKACHPDKFPDYPDATHAFQKVSVAYDVLSKPSSKRLYDSRQMSSPYNFSAQSAGYAEETFRSAIISASNDFLDGDLDMVRTMLRAMNDVNPSLKLGSDSIDSILKTLQSFRDRALTCRICVHAMHAEVTRLLELQRHFRRLSYLDVIGRSLITIQITRVTLNLPITLQKAIQQSINYNGNDPKSLLPRHINNLIWGIDLMLERMERMLK